MPRNNPKRREAKRQEMLPAKVTVIAHDMAEVELFRRDLIELHGVDWKKAVSEYKR